jgi:hypothetical protein
MLFVALQIPVIIYPFAFKDVPLAVRGGGMGMVGEKLVECDFAV